MRVLNVRNVHEALPRAVTLLEQIGDIRDSRNGQVLVSPEPVATVYTNPLERVIFWPERDANPFFHLYESIWMLAGRNDVAPLMRYVARSLDYSDDGVTLYGAYGYRWRVASGMDQLAIIAEQLRKNPEDRRDVLQMWDPFRDLGHVGKDVPCNVSAAFQRGSEGELNLTVFCRSNDIVWGAYGANAVQFATLLEYMALWIGCPVGTYTQISVNWHGYLNTLKQVEGIRPDRFNFIDNPYIDRRVHSVPMRGSIQNMDWQISSLLDRADNAKTTSTDGFEDWAYMVYIVLFAHQIYSTLTGPEKYEEALNALGHYPDQKADWIVAAREWVQRRQVKYVAKLMYQDIG